MISYNPKNWFTLIFQFHRSDTFRQLIWILLLFALYSTLVVALSLYCNEHFTLKSTTSIHSLLGFVFGLLLVFRTNTAYDRWWEGRKQWGALVNNTRNLAIKLHGILPSDQTETRAYFARMIPNYVFAMKEHLREGAVEEELDLMEKERIEFRIKDHAPNYIASELYVEINKLYLEGNMTGDQLINIDKEIKAFTDIIGACERIKNTPIPFSYSLFLKKFIFAYTVTMPLGMAVDFKYWTVPIVTFILYVFSSIELLAEEIEDPFGRDANDLPTDSLATKIKANVEEILL